MENHQKSLKNRNDLKFRNDLWCNDLRVSTVYVFKSLLLGCPGAGIFLVKIQVPDFQF